MSRRLFPFIGLILLASSVKAATNGTPTRENPIAYNKVGTAVTVSVSTSAWTKANSATTLVQDRSGLRITNPSGNTQPVYWICHAAAPTEAITVLINQISVGANGTAPCGSNLNLYLLSVTSAQSVGVWEVGQ